MSAPMTTAEVGAQLRAAEIRHRWTERNPEPPLHLPAKERRRAWAEYRARWAQSPAFMECSSLMIDGQICCGEAPPA